MLQTPGSTMWASMARTSKGQSLGTLIVYKDNRMRTIQHI